MGRARLEKDGTYSGDLPCKWCDVLIDQGGRRRPRLYCRWTHRWKKYGSNVVVMIAAILD
ncbi:hypothetical protein [Streptomyces sp. VRA16 Mangrove soil]|uniref:hypothetical protein n=1 Tax=Streptomyces sp. VRA16 Mangrove soil TaxID=2817434 RepID=UPI001A9F4630|nr:hypothetical protein [Streptomyces sp. VRA16 Mangrove soil]MBO1335955.1 hypothetical protein [Streptomyces sp. VRA16 Mangrove soil]